MLLSFDRVIPSSYFTNARLYVGSSMALVNGQPVPSSVTGNVPGGSLGERMGVYVQV